MRFSIFIGSVSLILAVIISAGAHYYGIRTAEIEAESIPPSRVFGINRYAERIIVQSVDPVSRTLIGSVRIPGVNQNVPMVFELHPEFVVRRRDVIIRNGAVVGTGTTNVATLEDLTQGTRGYGVVGRKENGRFELSYLIVGDPFPRP